MDYYLDEQLSPLIAEALDKIEGHEGRNRVYSTATAFGKGITDLELFERIRQANGVLVTHDLKMVTRKKGIRPYTRVGNQRLSYKLTEWG